ncbi:MAG TPA: ribonuclease HI [Patescibacteria group bacterium]|nr:ribonuclease HI [Patescibacteria group bacterium]
MTAEPIHQATKPRGESHDASRVEALLITDGSCICNPGPGGWACVMRSGDSTREIFGSEARTTNNRMELRAAIEGLNALGRPGRVTVVTDSQYLKNGITQWLPRWKANGWQRKSGGDGRRGVLNRDLWEELDAAASRHTVRWQWVRGHADHAANNRAHDLASAAARTAGRNGKS